MQTRKNGDTVAFDTIALDTEVLLCVGVEQQWHKDERTEIITSNEIMLDGINILHSVTQRAHVSPSDDSRPLRWHSSVRLRWTCSGRDA